MHRRFRALLGVAVAGLIGAQAGAEPWLAPGNTGLRSDLHTLADAGVLHAPLTTWPLSWGDIAGDLRDAPASALDDTARLALERVRARVPVETQVDRLAWHSRITLGERPRIMRTFDDTPREEAQLGGGLSRTGERFAFRLNAARVWDPADGESFRLDGSYAGVALGNWMLSVGYPERWWGPGWDGSLILSTNARPIPQIAINRDRSTPFRARWLSWLGPWSMTSFLGLLDDERAAVDDPLVFGLRLTARPLPRLEIGVSRTAQWCGEGRPCDAEAFVNLMAGRSNRGVNIAPEKEPGNQLAGFDLRWAPPFTNGPAAIYMQWIGEDTRQGGPQIGSWLRQVGVEFAGSLFVDQWRHRTHVEAAETICREGGAGFSSEQFNCAYEHSIYQSGYRYHGRSMAHGMDGDGRSYSAGTTLMSTDDRVWQFSLRHIDINRGGPPNARHTLSPTPQRISEATLIHGRSFAMVTLRAAIGYHRLEDRLDSSLDERSLFGWVELMIN